MSHSYASSTTATTASTAQPLSDVLPWGSPLVVDAPSSPPLDDDRRSSILRTRRRARTLLVTDGISADGRFVLHSLALQFLSSRAVRPSSSPSDSDDDRRRKSAEEGSVLWIGCGPLAESQICGGLRKGMAVRLGGIGGGERSLEREEHGETTGIGGVTTTAMGKLHVLSVPLELADASLLECNDGDAEKEEGKGDAFESNDNNDNEDDATAEEFSHERYLKGLHRRIVHWLHHRELLSVEAASAAKSTPRLSKQQQSQQQQQQQQNQQRDTDTTTNNTSSPYMGPNLVIVDNLSVFSSLFGDVLTHAFLTNVRAALKRHAARTSGEISSVASDDAGFENRKKDDHDPNNHMSTATATNHPTNATITTMITTNLLAVRCTSPDDGGLYRLNDDDDDDDVLDIGSESGRVLRTPSVKGERLRSEHARLLRPWWGMGSGCGSGSVCGNGLLGGVSDGVADATPTSVAMGGTIASSHSTICHLEERSHQRSLFPSAENGGVVGPHSTSSSTSLLHKIGMYEYSDGIVDVSPLESGYARDILGRISFTTAWGGRGWWGRGDEYGGIRGSGIGIGGKEKQSQDGSGALGEAYASICVNYRCEDGGVRVLRLRSR